MSIFNSHLVVGLGKSGISCARYLHRQKIPFAVADDRENPPTLAEFKKEFPNVKVHLGKFNPEIFKQADVLVVSPGLSLQTPGLKQAIQNGIQVIGDIELFARVAKAPIIGITGTNAKGTVTTLVGEMLQAAGKKVLVGGNIGIPALDLLNEPVPEFYVLELSSFQLETTYSLKLAAATILNVSDDHLDRHGTMANYIAAKQRIYQHCEAAIYNRDDKATFPIIDIAKQISFGLNKPAAKEFGILTIDNKNWLAFGDQPLIETGELLIKGRHNWANALAALALGYAIGLTFPPMLQATRHFKGLPHRCEWVFEQNSIVWYNDSKGTNVGATLAAIQGLGSAIQGKLVLIAGGQGKGADFTPLREPVKQYVRRVILYGQDALIIKNALTDTVPTQLVNNLKEAVQTAKATAQPNDAVLLSPACASWDMFKHYEERGDVFKATVKEIN